MERAVDVGKGTYTGYRKEECPVHIEEKNLALAFHGCLEME